MRGASGTDTFDSRVIFRQAGTTTDRTAARFDGAGSRLDSTAKAVGDGASTSGEETD